MSKSEFHFNLFEEGSQSSIFISSPMQDEGPFFMDQDDCRNSRAQDSCFYLSTEPAFTLLDSLNNNGGFEDLLYINQQNCLMIDQPQIMSDEQIVEEFTSLTSQDRFREARELLQINTNCSSYESQGLVISLMVFDLFSSIKSGNNEIIQYLYKQIIANEFYRGFGTSNTHLEILISSPLIFGTAFYSNKKKSQYVPAINRLATQLLLNKAQFSGSFARSEISILENIQEEMIFYMINYQRIYESTGDYDEIYLDFNTSYSKDNQIIKAFISEYIIEKEKQESIECRLKSFTAMNTNICFKNEKMNHKQSNDRSHHSSLTLGSDETSDRSKAKIKELIPIEKLHNYKFQAAKKQNINKKNLKFFKQYLKTTVKAKSVNYSSFIHDFCTNKLNPPVVVLDKKFTSCNDSYMIWLFSNIQIAAIYLEYIEALFDTAFESISKACEINDPNDLLYLTSYLKETAQLYSNPLTTMCPKKVYKARKKRDDEKTDTDVNIKSSSNVFRISTSVPTTDIIEESEQLSSNCKIESECVQVIEFEISNLFGDASADIYSS